MTTIPQHIVMADDEHDTDVRFESFPGSVTIQYYDKDSRPIGVCQSQEFLTLASYLLWVLNQASYFTLGTQEYSEFAYFVATRPLYSPIKIETQYVIRSYEFTKA